MIRPKARVSQTAASVRQQPAPPSRVPQECLVALHQELAAIDRVARSLRPQQPAVTSALMAATTSLRPIVKLHASAVRTFEADALAAVPAVKSVVRQKAREDLALAPVGPQNIDAEVEARVAEAMRKLVGSLAEQVADENAEEAAKLATAAVTAVRAARNAVERAALASDMTRTTTLSRDPGLAEGIRTEARLRGELGAARWANEIVTRAIQLEASDILAAAEAALLPMALDVLDKGEAGFTTSKNRDGQRLSDVGAAFAEWRKFVSLVKAHRAELANGVPEAQEALEHLMACFRKLIGIDGGDPEAMAPAEFQRRYLSAGGPAPDPLELDSGGAGGRYLLRYMARREPVRLPPWTSANNPIAQPAG